MCPHCDVHQKDHPKTSSVCEQCKIPLHPECMWEWHSRHEGFDGNDWYLRNTGAVSQPPLLPNLSAHPMYPFMYSQALQGTYELPASNLFLFLNKFTALCIQKLRWWSSLSSWRCALFCFFVCIVVPNTQPHWAPSLHAPPTPSQTASSLLPQPTPYQYMHATMPPGVFPFFDTTPPPPFFLCPVTLP